MFPFGACFLMHVLATSVFLYNMPGSVPGSALIMESMARQILLRSLITQIVSNPSHP